MSRRRSAAGVRARCRAAAARRSSRPRPPPIAPRRRRRSVAELLATAHARLGYLKIVTPKKPEDALDALLGGAPGARRYVVHDGRVVELGDDAAASSAGPGRAHSNWGAGNMDPDSLARHANQMKRFRFEDRAGPVRSPWDR